jgi:MOSC domain-containing protein YiiM
MIEQKAKKIGSVIEIFSSTKEDAPGTRPKVEALQMIKEHGILNDKFAGKNPDSCVMVVGEAGYDLAAQNGIELIKGSLGENILFNFNPNHLKVDAVLQIGDVQLQVTQKCTICNHLAVHRADLPKLIADDRGMYCRVLQDGIVKKGMEVFLHE